MPEDKTDGFDVAVKMLKEVWPHAIPWVAVAGSAIEAAGYDSKPFLHLVFMECARRDPGAFQEMLDNLE